MRPELHRQNANHVHHLCAFALFSPWHYVWLMSDSWHSMSAHEGCTFFSQSLGSFLRIIVFKKRARTRSILTRPFHDIPQGKYLTAPQKCLPSPPLPTYLAANLTTLARVFLPPLISNLLSALQALSHACSRSQIRAIHILPCPHPHPRPHPIPFVRAPRRRRKIITLPFRLSDPHSAFLASRVRPI